MSRAVVSKLEERFAARILATSDFRGDDEVTVAPQDWEEVARYLRDDPALGMNHFVDLTAIDYPEREPEGPRFDVTLSVRAQPGGARVRVRTRVEDGEGLATLCDVWVGANWAEREVWDMFGIPFTGHPDLRRILMYDEFIGHPLRKDYPIQRAQPLVPYRDDPGNVKLPPFGVGEGQPFGRIHWSGRLAGEDAQVSPAIALQTGQRPALSASDAHTVSDAHTGTGGADSAPATSEE
jgi:NADH-quinone oxidoreductase subunit C